MAVGYGSLRKLFDFLCREKAQGVGELGIESLENSDIVKMMNLFVGSLNDFGLRKLRDNLFCSDCVLHWSFRSESSRRFHGGSNRTLKLWEIPLPGENQN